MQAVRALVAYSISQSLATKRSMDLQYFDVKDDQLTQKSSVQSFKRD